MSTRQFLVVWDCYGLECVADYTEYSEAKTWATLQDKPCEKTFPSLTAIMLRARYNSHRHYEIYAVEAADGITREDLIELFNDNPQHAADLIRERGSKIFSDRASTNVAIT